MSNKKLDKTLNRWVKGIYLCSHCLEICRKSCGVSACCRKPLEYFEVFDSSIPKEQRKILFWKWRWESPLDPSEGR